MFFPFFSRVRQLAGGLARATGGPRGWLALLALAGSVGVATAQFPGGMPGMPNMPTGGGGSGSGGGIDDSTKMVYGPTTTRYLLERDITNNRETYYTVDTTLEGFHNYHFVNRRQNQFQDLGNVGTAMRPVFYEAPRQIGAQLGFDAYSPYAFTPDSLRYYDTRSPFSSLYYVQGGAGIQVLDVQHSRNVNQRWNVGFRYQNVTSLRQGQGFGGSDPNANRLVDSHTFALYSRYQSKDSTYQILGYFTTLRHKVFEQGGLGVLRPDGRVVPVGNRPLTLTLLDTLFTPRLQQPLLTAAQSEDRRSDLHFYQQYAPAAGFQLYHVFDRQRRFNGYKDARADSSLRRGFYPALRFTPTQLDESVNYLLFENRVGIKGIFTTQRYGSFNYRAYLRRRDYRLTSGYLAYRTDARSETFAGGWLNYYRPDSSQVFVEAEYLLGRDYQLRAEYRSRWLTAGYYTVGSSPTLVQERFLSNAYEWGNNFNLVASNNVYGQLRAQLGKLTVSPSLTVSNVTNFIYFDQRATPQQRPGSLQVLRVGLGAQFQTRRFLAMAQAYYTRVSDASVLRIPELFVNGRIAYQVLFRKVLYIQLGAELHYKSAYLADAYQPLMQQFHLQDDLLVPGYAAADLFANFRINRVRVFVKFAHANAGLMAQPGYFPTPVYTALGSTFGFGVNWLLFD